MLHALKRMLSMPTAAAAVAHMYPIECPPARFRPHRDLSELLVVGHYEEGGDLTVVGLAYFSAASQAFIDANTRAPVSVPITHWILARDQQRLSEPGIVRA